ncbi:MAG: hypothetical protein OMM_06836 [Candidatus Magnetoglobus multicellularis str. Araruama]|uniref:Methyl-accepting chemotaxis protein n=1 Tax=Candidatus Magnetoglobus multicellularis str. Araruama TaxID=890399 RepID=A0A1V1PFQ4_9BACT|nr:MAG: hypothetical protein OMM_06836 [Candidatus Magnetoglobus multicellularis str. Araruama]
MITKLRKMGIQAKVSMILILAVAVILVLSGTGNYYYTKAKLISDLNALAESAAKRLEMHLARDSVDAAERMHDQSVNMQKIVRKLVSLISGQ